MGPIAPRLGQGFTDREKFLVQAGSGRPLFQRENVQVQALVERV